MTNAELIKALRYHADATIRYCDGCPYLTIHKTNGMCLDSMIIDAADALEAAEKRIAELEAQLPKEGEWIWDSDTGTYHCSECNATSPQEDQDGEYIDCPNYCPNCGARMRGEHDEQADS